MKLTPDNFEPITDIELREIWTRYRNADVRRLILELRRARGVTRAANGDALKAKYAM